MQMMPSRGRKLTLPIESDPNDYRTIFTTLKECMRLSRDKATIVSLSPNLAQSCGNHRTDESTHHSKVSVCVLGGGSVKERGKHLDRFLLLDFLLSQVEWFSPAKVLPRVLRQYHG